MTDAGPDAPTVCPAQSLYASGDICTCAPSRCSQLTGVGMSRKSARTNLITHTILAALPLLVAVPPGAMAQTEPASGTPENASDADSEIIVTAQRRSEDILDVPVSVDVLSGQRLENRFSSGDSLLALAGASPGLYIESSSGRTAPRLYMRGLGNSDFNQAASQPVSIVLDEVPIEKSGLRSFPIFDVDRVEVVRGPQGTLFGRNAIAGVVRFESRRPTDAVEGFTKFALGEYGVSNIEAAVGGPLLGEALTGRLSLLSQNRADWIDNAFTGEQDAIGGFTELAGRVQLLWRPTQDLSALLIYQGRSLKGHSSTPFRANILTRGSNDLNGNYSRDRVFFDGGGNQRSEAEHQGLSLEVNWALGDLTVTSVTSLQNVQRYGRADVDGGFGPGPRGRGPGFIPFPVDTGTVSDIEQLTQEVRLASDFGGPFNFQVGAFLFSDTLDFQDLNASQPPPSPGELGVLTTSIVENDSWAVFGHASYDLTERLRATAGVRYTYDEKSARFGAPPTSTSFALVQTIRPINLEDENVSWDAALSYRTGSESQLYGRIATGFRAPTVQTTVRTDPDVTTADSETIVSYEVGYKTNLFEKLRLNSAAFYYIVSDIQLTAVGGDSPGGGISLLNADEGVGYGFEIDAELRASDALTVSAGIGYSRTELREAGLSTGACISCTVLDPRTALGRAVIDGNPFPQAPLWTANFEVDYRRPLSDDSELFVFTDWKVRGETSFFLYDSVEFVTDTQFEGGLRAGYRNLAGNYELAVFGRNITDEENLLGGIDFNNLTGYVNEPRILGVDLAVRF